MNNLTLFTYTHSRANDLHVPFYSRVKQYFSDITNIIATSDTKIDTVDTVIYDDSQDHYIQMLNALNYIQTDYVLYTQEDYILFDYVDIEKINKITRLLDKNSEVSFVRLIQSAIEGSTSISENYLLLSPEHEYYFSTQATIWRKKDLIRTFESSKVKNLKNEPDNSVYLKNLNTHGLCTTLRGSAIGGHFNSKIFPYIATAVIKGKWNYSEYKNELDIFFNEFNIDKNIRGIV